MMAARLISQRLEINGGLVVLLAVASLSGALWIYTQVQTNAQERLAEAFREAEFEGPFCDEHVALDGTLCRESPRMSWQQIHTLLATAQVIDVNEYKSCSELETRFNEKKTEGLDDLLKMLRGSEHHKEPEEPECSGEVSEDEEPEKNKDNENGKKCPPDEQPEGKDGEPEQKTNLELNENSKKCPPDENSIPGGQPEGKDGESEQKTALGLIVRLAKNQCTSDSTAKCEEPSGVKRKSSSERLQGFLSLALADALGNEGVFGDRCESAREALKEIGDWTKSGQKAPEETGSDKNKNLRQCKERTRPSGWRFSTEKCLSDALILGRLMEQHQIIGRDSGELAGYNVTGCGGIMSTTEKLDRFGAFTTLMKYVLGRVHAEPGVQDARKYANLVRGPEHIGILTAALLITSLVLLRGITFELRYARARRKVENENAQALRQLAVTLARGGDAAEREHEALARGRVRVQWGLATIPAIGFVGTVRGILEALSKAGDVVWAADRLERADAISGLAGELGLAFSTTLFALLVGIAVGLLVTVARVREGRGLDRLADRAEGERRAKEK